MFILLNKEKIVSYIVSFSTVGVLFVMSSIIMAKKNDNILHTSAEPKDTIIENEKFEVDDEELKNEMGESYK